MGNGQWNQIEFLSVVRVEHIFVTRRVFFWFRSVKDHSAPLQSTDAARWLYYNIE